MGGHFHLWAVVCIRSQSFVFMAVIFICLHSWPVIYVRGQSFAFIGGRFHCMLWLVVGAVSWLSCRGCRGRRRLVVVVVVDGRKERCHTL